MRIRFACEVINDKPCLQWNHKNSLRGLFYKMLNGVNEKNGKEIHGNSHNGKKFSSFCLSPLEFECGINTNKKGILPRTKNFSFEVSTTNDLLASTLKNVNLGEIFQLNNEFFFKLVRAVEVESTELYGKIFRSHIIQTVKDESGKNRTRDIEDKNYETALFNNLIQKYRSISGDDQTEFNVSTFNFKVYNFRKKSEKYKGVNLYYHDVVFSLDCPLVLKKVAYLNGVGSKNSLGFGYLNIV